MLFFFFFFVEVTNFPKAIKRWLTKTVLAKPCEIFESEEMSKAGHFLPLELMSLSVWADSCTSYYSALSWSSVMKVDASSPLRAGNREKSGAVWCWLRNYSTGQKRKFNSLYFSVNKMGNVGCTFEQVLKWVKCRLWAFSKCMSLLIFFFHRSFPSVHLMGNNWLG